MAARQFAQALEILRHALNEEQPSIIYEQLFHHTHSGHASSSSGDEMEADPQDISGTFSRFLSDLVTLCSRVEAQTSTTFFANTQSRSDIGNMYPSHLDAYSRKSMTSPQKRSAPVKEYIDIIDIRSDDNMYEIDLNHPSFHKIGEPVRGTAALYLQPPCFTHNASVPTFVAPHTLSHIQPTQIAAPKASYLRSATQNNGLRASVPNSLL
jgi:hypothetical protein